MECGRDDGKFLEVLCLQKYPEFVDQAVALLNSEWPRSRTARLRSIEQGSSSGLPTCLVLIDKTGEYKNGKVLAHCKISPVPSDPSLCFVESVVVDRNVRGKGFGRLLMNATEEFVKTIGIRTVYLTTFDQQKFYEKLGYSLCEPIVVFGGRTQSLTNIVNRNKDPPSVRNSAGNKSVVPVLSSSSSSSVGRQEIVSGYRTCSQIESSQLKSLPELNQKSSAIFSPTKSSLPPPPPPPPPPPNTASALSKLTKDNIKLMDKDVKVTLRKTLV